jgi:hypothetical protein
LGVSACPRRQRLFEASPLVIVLAALARGPRVLGLLAGLVAATLLLAGLVITGLVLAAALLVLTALARMLRVLRILWILIHTSHSSCPSPNSIGRNQKVRKLNDRKQKL